MQWYYSANGQQQGPVSQTELEALARTGVVTPETLVWREGMANWMAYGAVATAPAPGLAPSGAAGFGGGVAQCTECGKTFPMDEMVKFETAWVCASCKPLFVQKIREGVTISGVGMWKYKKQLVTNLNPVLPARCVKCNAPTDSPQKKRKLYWHPPLVYLALFFNIIIYAIVAMLVRKRSTAMVSICPEHRAKRRNAILISWLLVVVGIVAIFGGIANDSGWVGGGGGVLLLGGIIYGIVKGRLIYAMKIDKEHVWIGGCGADFLAGFPEWNG